MDKNDTDSFTCWVKAEFQCPGKKRKWTQPMWGRDLEPRPLHLARPIYERGTIDTLPKAQRSNKEAYYLPGTQCGEKNENHKLKAHMRMRTHFIFSQWYQNPKLRHYHKASLGPMKPLANWQNWYFYYLGHYFHGGTINPDWRWSHSKINKIKTYTWRHTRKQSTIRRVSKHNKRGIHITKTRYNRPEYDW